MKTLLLTFSALFIVVISDAQIPAGTKLIGGNLGISHQEQQYFNDKYRSASVSINPTFGKAIKENLVSGMSLSYSYFKSSSRPSDYERHFFGLNLYRQKFLPVSKAFMAFGSGRIGGGYSLGNNDYKSYNVAAGLGAGLAYSANDRLLVTLSLPDVVSTYVNYSTENVAFTTGRIRTFNTGINSSLSFQAFQIGVLLMRK